MGDGLANALMGAQAYCVGKITFFDISKTPNISYAINTLQQSGAICKKENNKFFWYTNNESIKNEHIFNPLTFKGRLFQYQQEDANKLINMNRALLAHKTGLGKTIISVAASNYLKLHEHQNRKILIICPRSIQQQWKDEYSEHTNLKAKIYGEQGFTDADVLIITYSRLRISIDEIAKVEFLVTIFDEANFVKNTRVKVSKAAYRITSLYKWELTATPIKNTPLEIYSLMKVHDLSSFLFGSEFDYIKRYATRTFIKFLNREITTGYKNLDELKLKINDVLVKRDKNDSDVIEQLGSAFNYIQKTLNMEFTPAQRKIHIIIQDEINTIVSNVKEAFNVDIDFYSEDEGKNRPELKEYKEKVLALYTADRMLSCSVQCLIKSKSPIISNLLSSLSPDAGSSSNKIEEVLRIIEQDIDEDEKIILYTSFTRFAEEIAQALGKKNISYELASGDTNYTEAIERFKIGKAQALIITSIGKYGLNLQMASKLVLCDIPFTPSEVEQIIGRVSRIGQKQVPVIYFLVSAGGVEAKIYDNLNKKKLISNMIFG